MSEERDTYGAAAQNPTPTPEISTAINATRTNRRNRRNNDNNRVGAEIFKFVGETPDLDAVLGLTSE